MRILVPLVFLGVLVLVFGYIVPRDIAADREVAEFESCARAKHDWTWLFDKSPQTVDDQLKMVRIYEKVLSCGGTELKPRYL